MTEEALVVRKLYEIVSILKTESPPGAVGSDWHRYEIAHGTNIINGYKQGSLNSVTAAVEENVAQLNERYLYKRSQVTTPKNKLSN